jgi:hypothetical protein
MRPNRRGGHVRPRRPQGGFGGFPPDNLLACPLHPQKAPLTLHLLSRRYAALLWKNRAKIKQEEEEREKDEALMQSAFLWEPYKPSFWWFEIFETARRLAMTGVLGAISPGSDVQLASGIVMTFGGTMVYCICMPFSELKDNILGILTNAQIFLVMLTAMVMKHNAGGEGEDGVGVLLIFMNVLCVLVFVGFGVVQAYSYKHDFDNDKQSEAGLAMGVLKGNKKNRDEGEPPRTSTGESEETQVEEGRGQREAAARVGGREGIELMENPMRAGKGKLGGNAAKKDGDRARADSLGKGDFHKKPTQGGGKLGKKTGGDNATLPEAAPPPAKETTWVQHVDEKSGHPFYESGAGETSWDEPFAREGSAWRSLVDGRVVYDEPQNVI